jgi:hypothetical protein
MTQEQIDALRAAALHASSFNPLTNDFTEERRRLDALATEAHPLAILSLLAERDALLRVAEAARELSDADDLGDQWRALERLRISLAALTPGETSDAR